MSKQKYSGRKEPKSPSWISLHLRSSAKEHSVKSDYASGTRPANPSPLKNSKNPK